MKTITLTLLLILGITACKDDAVDTSPLLEGRWNFLGFGNARGQLVESEPAGESDSIVIEFQDGQFAGRFGINRAHASYQVLNDLLMRMRNLTVTEMAGSEWQQKFEDNFPQDSTRYVLRADTLVLFPTGEANQMPSYDDTPTVYVRCPMCQVKTTNGS